MDFIPAGRLGWRFWGRRRWLFFIAGVRMGGGRELRGGFRICWMRLDGRIQRRLCLREGLNDGRKFKRISLILYIHSRILRTGEMHAHLEFVCATDLFES